MKEWTVRLLLAMALCTVSPSIAAGQGTPPMHLAGAKTNAPVFDVATIKPNNSMSGSVSIHTTADMYSATNLSLKLLVENAYGIKQNLIAGLPGWAESAHYDIVAKVIDTDIILLRSLTREQRREMLQHLLAERFQFKSHVEIKTLPVFELVLGSDGPAFKESPTPTDGSKPHEGTSIQNNDMTAQGISMEGLANVLTDAAGRKVIDKTELTGRYDLHLKWRREEDDGSKDDAPPLIFDAVRQQLGLKMQPAKGPVDTLVVDRIAMPSEN